LRHRGTSQYVVNANELCTKALPAYADSEYVSYVWVDRMEVEFIGNKQTHKQTYRY